MFFQRDAALFAAANDTEAATAITGEAPSDVYVDTNIQTVPMFTLEAILTGTSFDDVLDASANEPIVTDGGGEQYVYPMSAALTHALAALSDGQLPAAANAWWETEEIEADGWELDQLTTVLTQIRDLARITTTKNHHLYQYVTM